VKKILLLVAFLFSLVHFTEKAWATKVLISGKAQGYGQKTIELNTLHDFISEEKIRLGTIRFNTDETFKLEVDITETTLCFADFDGYHGMIYLEPGHSYEIVFPPKHELSESQKRNPFFKSEPVWFGIRNADKSELNFRIQQFEQAYTTYENKYFDRIFVNQAKSLVDTVKLKLDSEFPKTNDAFFEAHKLFRLANLDFALSQGKSARFMETYFSSQKPFYNLAAYTTIFNQVFQNYFDVLINQSNNQEIKKLILSANIHQLDVYFQEKLKFNPSLSHLILLRSLHDGYYSKQFSKSLALKMLDQVKGGEWSNLEQETAKLIRSKLTYMASGTLPPAINLKNLSGQKISLSDFPGTYIYLHFTDPKNSICRQHLDALKTIDGHYKGKLVIINVVPKGSQIKPENGWAGIFTTSDSNLEETFKVKTFPNSFLIGKDGRLLLSPAPNPIDGLDRQLGQIIKSDYFREQQKSGK
jgi:hypothetical protein